MKKFIQYSFIVCALLAFALPILKFNRKGTVSEREKRALAEKPYLFKENRLNKNYFSEFDEYFSDRFGGRSKLIYLNSQINYNVLHAAQFNENAIKGKNGWYFYISKSDGDNLSDFCKTNLLSKTELESFGQNVKNTVDWCNGHGIKTLFVICPNKHSVYPEYYPIPRPKGITRADQLIQIFEELGVNYVFPHDYLISKKAESSDFLYWETDFLCADYTVHILESKA